MWPGNWIVTFFSSILHVTNGLFAWYGHMIRKKHLAEWQTTQRGKKNKEITAFKKLISFLFKVPLRLLQSSKVIFVSCDRLVQRGLQRAHFKVTFSLHAAFLAGKSLSDCSFFCQEIVCPPAFFIKKTEHIQVSYKVLRINKGKKIIATLILL